MLKLVLDYITVPEVDILYACLLILTTFAINMGRGALFNAMFVVGTHTGKQTEEKKHHTFPNSIRYDRKLIK